MHVAHVVSGLDRRSGGVAAAVLGLAAAQARAGLRVSVLTTFVDGEDLGPAEAELADAGIPLVRVGPASRRLIGYHPRTRAHVRGLLERADVLHVHALWEDVQHQAMRVARGRRLPYVVSPHGMLARWSLRQGSLKKRLYLWLRLGQDLDHAAAIHFTTHEEARQAGPLSLRPPALVEALGLDLTEFAALPTAGSFRDRHPSLGDRPVALFLSRVHPKKGLDLLVPAFAKAGVDDARLVIAGPDEGGYAATVRALVSRHGLDDRVVFTGMLRGRDRIAALADADLFVLPSYQENFGIVVPEALAAGTPAVVSDQVNFSEHLQGESFAEVVPCDTERLATALRQWLTDAPRRQKAGAAARPWAMGRFDWATVAARWVGHYENIVRSPLPCSRGRGLG